MSLEDKIKQILNGLNEGKAEDVLKAAANYESGSSDKQKDDDENQDDNDSDDKDDGKTDLSKDKKEDDKDEKVVGESETVPGIGKSLKMPDQELSGTSKTTKTVAKYNKGTKQEKVEDVAKNDSTDSKATSETAKINKDYKPNVQGKLTQEAFEALFSGETLTESFKTKAEAIFEAAVEQVTEAKIKDLEEEHQLNLTEAVEEAKGELVDQIDGYLGHVVESWLNDNAVALESGIKVEMVSSFMENMKQVFTEHYIDVPESKLDVVAEQSKQIEEIQSQLDKAIQEANDAKVECTILTCEAIIAKHSQGLTAIEADKLYSLAEAVEFTDEETYTSKVSALKESYFRKGAKDVTSQEKQTPITENKIHSDVEAVLKAMKSPIIRSSN
jgi:acetylglutamate kinase